MLYAILCFNDEKMVGAWTKEQDDAVMARLDVVHGKLARAGRLGPTARLAGTSKAKTLRKQESGADGRPLVVDGPFAETKEQFLGFYIVDCVDIDEALAIAADLAEANPGPGGYEVRPVMLHLPGTLGAKAAAE